MGLSPTSRRGNAYVIAMGDYFTKWVEAVMKGRQSQKYLCNIFLPSLKRHGEYTQTREGTSSRVYLRRCASNWDSIRHTHNGLPSAIRRYSGKVNPTMGTMIVAYDARHVQSWDGCSTNHGLPGNASLEHRLHPNRVMLGREMAQLVEVMVGNPLNQDGTEGTDAQEGGQSGITAEVVRTVHCERKGQ